MLKKIGRYCWVILGFFVLIQFTASIFTLYRSTEWLLQITKLYTSENVLPEGSLNTIQEKLPTDQAKLIDYFTSEILNASGDLAKNVLERFNHSLAIILLYVFITAIWILVKKVRKRNSQLEVRKNGWKSGISNWQKENGST